MQHTEHDAVTEAFATDCRMCQGGDVDAVNRSTTLAMSIALSGLV
jgi:hypothetical protein